MSKPREELFITDFHNTYKENGLTLRVIELFKKLIYDYFRNHKRKFPFREKITPYNVLISEIMLQQTQTGRVSEKFSKFIAKFPDFLSLSSATLEEVLIEWKGLGYNRRAIALKKIAKTVINDFNGELPDSLEILKSFPQIGHNTASSILTFAFNKPMTFIETNIRRVYIYFFFPNKSLVNDKDIMTILKKTIDNNNPREWYYALMDYGVMLKKVHPELNKKSAHYRKQTPFNGSTRQVRGELLKLLIKEGKMEITKIQEYSKINDMKRIKKILDQLKKEGFIEIEEDTVKIAK
ncbi:MAG: A/G-specific adenine glycosylase [Candidatus Lokiarchaeota archaeon]|nr:A/G-specific adenine glycosylase [Candidatus Lokiarchaeota archaeon]